MTNSSTSCVKRSGTCGLARLPEGLALSAIAAYRNLISPLKPPTCRFHPSCSVYARDAILRYGLGRGGWLTLKRLARCHPWHPGGYDPVE